MPNQEVLRCLLFRYGHRIGRTIGATALDTTAEKSLTLLLVS
jgi:hypothetical protein